jgi:hypothetical protein
MRLDVTISFETEKPFSRTQAIAAESLNHLSSDLRSIEGRMIVELRIFATITSLSADHILISSSSLVICACIFDIFLF